MKKKLHYNVTKPYLEYIKTNNEKYFSQVIESLRPILRKQYKANKYFTQQSVYTFDDIFSYTIIKLYSKKHIFDPNKGNIVTFAYMVFYNELRQIIRKEKKHQKNIKLVDIN